LKNKVLIVTPCAKTIDRNMNKSKGSKQRRQSDHCAKTQRNVWSERRQQFLSNLATGVVSI